MLSALARLPEPQRAALSLIALEEFSYEEAAKVLDIPIGTLMSRLARGRESLRQMTRGEAAAAAADRRRPEHRSEAMSGQDIGEDELQAFVDGQLPQGRSTAVLAHLGRHPQEIPRLAQYALQKEELRRGLDAISLPGDDPTTLQLQRRARRPSETARSTAHWLRRAATVVLLLAAGWASHGLYQAYREHQLPSLVVEAAQAHEVFGGDSQRPVELTAASRTEMAAWFSRHLGEAIEIPSLRAIGLRLVGGRLLPGDDSPVAQLIYEDSAKRRLTLCLSAATSDAGPVIELVEVEGMTAGYWQDGEVNYALVAHTPDLQLVAIASELGAEEPADLL